MRRCLSSTILLFGVMALLAVNHLYSAPVDQNNDAPGGVLRVLAADTFVFPGADDTRFTSRGERFWNAGDYVQGTRVLTAPAHSVEMTLMVSLNSLSGDTQDHQLMIDGAVIGTFSIAAGASQVSKTFTFPTLAAGSHTIRIETVRTVKDGCGSAGLPNGVSTLIFRGPTTPPSKDLILSPPTGRYFITQQCELGLILKSPLPVVRATAAVDGRDISSALGDYVIPGTLGSGGRAFRCPALTVGSFGSGEHRLEVILHLSDGSQAGSSVVWTIESLEEGLITR